MVCPRISKGTHTTHGRVELLMLVFGLLKIRLPISFSILARQSTFYDMSQVSEVGEVREIQIMALNTSGIHISSKAIIPFKNDFMLLLRPEFRRFKNFWTIRKEVPKFGSHSSLEGCESLSNVYHSHVVIREDCLNTD